MHIRSTFLATVAGGLALLAAPTLAAAAPHRDSGLTIDATPQRILAGQGLLITGRLAGADAAGRTIVLYHRINPHRGFSVIGATTTDARGDYEFIRPDGIVDTNREWFARGPGHSHSRTVHERVAALLSLDAAQTSGTTNHRIAFTGDVFPDQRFRRVRLQQQDRSGGEGWHTIATTFTGRDSRFALAHAWRRPGVYTVRALFRGDARNTTGESDSVTVTIQQAQNPSFTIAGSSPVVSIGSPATISGRLYRAGTTTPLADTQVTLYARQFGGPTEAIETTITRGDGSYSFTQTPVHNTVYRVALTQRPRRRSARLFEGVQDAVTASASSGAAALAQTVTVSGSVTPDKAGHAILLQQLGADGRWQDVTRGFVTRGSTYSLPYELASPGAVQLRVRIYGGPENVGAASSPVTVTAT